MIISPRSEPMHGLHLKHSREEVFSTAVKNIILIITIYLKKSERTRNLTNRTRICKLLQAILIKICSSRSKMFLELCYKQCYV